MFDIFTKLFLLALVIGILISWYVSLSAPPPPKDYDAWLQSDLEVYFIDATPCELAVRMLLNFCATCNVQGCVEADEGCWLYVK